MAFLQNMNEEAESDSGKGSPAGYKGLIDFGGHIAYHSKQFFDEFLTPMIKEQFDLCYDGSHTWFGSWENHMRKVITMFFLKGDSAIMEWGYNFDFLPIAKSNRIVYYRTEKSVRTQLWTYPKSFMDVTQWKDYKIPMHVRSKEELGKSIEAVWKLTLPEIMDWFLRVNSIETAICEAEYQIEYGKRYAIFSPRQLYVKAFLLAYTGDMESAERILKETLEYDDISEDMQGKLLKKLKNVYKI